VAITSRAVAMETVLKERGEERRIELKFNIQTQYAMWRLGYAL
jgi:hypothetical protein